MNLRVILFICTGLLISACAQPSVNKRSGDAFIRSNYPIIKVNGNEIDPAYSLDLEAGENIVVIVYYTYKYDYFCTFSWNAVANTVYEVTDQENLYPLTLYRWVKTNSVWASRLDPLNPLECVQEARNRKSANE
jgi:hypothetical protein